MPRGGKKSAQRGNRRQNTTLRDGGRNGSSSVPRYHSGASASTTRGHHAFTLQDEARNTERHHSFWSTDSKLRNSNVNFVRGGSLEPSLMSPELETTTTSLADMAIESNDQKADQEMVVEVYEGQETQDSSDVVAQDLFYLDTQATQVATGLPPPRVASPTSSDSGSDVILFGGRDEHGIPIIRSKAAARVVSDPVEEKIKEVEERLHQKEKLLEGVLQDQAVEEPETIEKIIVESKIEVNGDVEVEVEEEIEVEVHPQKSRKKRRHAKNNRGREDAEQDEEEALIADYLANIDEDPDFLESFGRRELGGTEEEHWLDDTGLSDSEPHLCGASPWDRDDINDFDDLSTSDGVMGNVAAILSKRERQTGVQYLVVWEQQSVDEARWVPIMTLISANAQLHIDQFEAEEKLVAEFEEASDSDTDSTESSGEDNDGSIEMPAPQALGKMSDEKYARLLAKQQELGIDVDELVLFDGEDDEENVETDEDVHFAPHFIPVTRSRRSKGQGRANRRGKGDFPVASLLADAYDGYDVMDFDRPSLKKKPKGRKANLVFDLSDSELEASMQAAWENDRVKKKERKQEREDLRTQGLLGSKNSKVSMRDKYKEGMGMLQIKEEIKLFLQSGHTTLALPPMEKEERKSVHQVANAFNLKSKSDGSGKKRFPILYKTQRTQPFSELTFDAIATGMSRRFLKRPDVKGRKATRAQDRGANMGAVSYRDGDIVGASAAELGVENRGRAMLEKMGWSKGTALGAVHNKGILQPIVHVVKNSKAGLG